MRTILRYEAGHAIWSESTPAYARTSGWSGSSIVDAIPSLAPVTRAPKVPEVPDYVARAAKGWATRRGEA